MRLITARDRANVLTSDISSLETRIASLTTELENKRAVLRAAKEEVDDMKVRIQYNLDKRNGLCIRYVQAFRISQQMMSRPDRCELANSGAWRTRLSRTCCPFSERPLARTWCANTGR
jgi:outer membrane murein-binding lipoprotein Lpp